MPNSRSSKLSKPSISMLAAAAVVSLAGVRLQAQPTTVADIPAGSEVACSIQTSSGLRDCDDTPSARSCDDERSYASQPSDEAIGIALVNRSDRPVKVYWLNFQGQRVLYDPFLAPGARHAQQTFVGHNWVVATMADQCLGIFRTAPPPSVGSDVSVTTAPPEIPVDDQPPPPAEDLIWTPGYWAWSGDSGDYYWAPGAWVAAPIVGYLWTPGYWLVQGRLFVWRAGYWGPHVGFYGGINYGHGYFGRGFVGGAWRDGRMMYNSAVTNVGNFKSNNVYNQAVFNNESVARVSYNGGGVRPNAAELGAATEIHIPPTAAQLQQLRTARNNPALRAGSNYGRPSVGATRTGDLPGVSVAPAQRAGTLSVTHFDSPSRPIRAASVAVPDKAAAVSSTISAAQAQHRPLTPQPQPHVTQVPAEPQSAPQEIQRPRQSSTQTRPRPVTHPEGHAP